ALPTRRGVVGLAGVRRRWCDRARGSVARGVEGGRDRGAVVVPDDGVVGAGPRRVHVFGRTGLHSAHLRRSRVVRPAMPTIVGAFGVPHMPTSPGDCAANPESLVARAFAAVRAHVDEIDPDVLLVFDTDHFHHWFYDRLPAFAIGVAVRTDGPGTDDWPGEARFDEISVDEALARHVYASGLAAAFDLALSEEFQVDHSITVPVHVPAETRRGV